MCRFRDALKWSWSHGEPDCRSLRCWWRLKRRKSLDRGIGGRQEYLLGQTRPWGCGRYCRGKRIIRVSYIFYSLLISDYLGFSLFLGHLRTFSVYRPFSHFSAFFGLSRYVYSIKWSKNWSKMVYDFKFRPFVFSGLIVAQNFQKFIDHA